MCVPLVQVAVLYKSQITETNIKADYCASCGSVPQVNSKLTSNL